MFRNISTAALLTYCMLKIPSMALILAEVFVLLCLVINGHN